jgi:hypothetical protein
MAFPIVTMRVTKQKNYVKTAMKQHIVLHTSFNVAMESALKRHNFAITLMNVVIERTSRPSAHALIIYAQRIPGRYATE